MKKLLISLAVTSALGLAGCGDSLQDLKEDKAQNNEVLVPLSRVVYDPSGGKVSVPNDLLFQGSTDGTLVMPGESAATPNYLDPQTGLGALDGWSTQNPFSIELSVAGGYSLDGTTVARPDAVQLVEVLMGDPASTDATCKTVPRGIACKAVANLTWGTDFITKAVGNNVAVIPLKPLKPATTYILVLTNVLKDSGGRSIAPSTTYELVKQDLATLPLGSEAQRALQGVINSYETAVSQVNIAKSNIIYTAAITTQSTANVLATVKKLMLPNPALGNAPPSIQGITDTKLVASDLLFPGEVIPDDPTNSKFFSKLAKVYTGTIQVPYYLNVPSAENKTAPLTTSWKARCDSGAIIASLSAAQVTALEGAIKDPAQMANDAYCKAVSNGALRDFGLDKARHLTKFNAIPKPQSTQTLKVQITVPNAAYAAVIPGVAKPETGYPVVILQHGITSCKENMLAITGALSARGFATVAIDHPLHGSRGFDYDNDGTDDIQASGAACRKAGDATHYMNLSSLLSARDNVRQSIADMLALRLGVNFASEKGLFNAADVQFLGHSLGAITGTSFVALANTPTGLGAAADGLYAIKSDVQAMPGGALANFLLESGAFGNLIKASVMLGSTSLATDFKAYIATQKVCDNPTSAAAYTNCASTQVTGYLAKLTTDGKTATLAAISSTFSQFAFAGQTTLDAADANNYAAMLAASKTPTHVIEVVGDGAANKSDQVIPNQSSNMPLAGTEPLAKLIGVKALPATAGGYKVEFASLARFNAGDHSSILSPAASLQATAEMQTQAVSFFMTRGAAVQVTNAAVIKGQ